MKYNKLSRRHFLQGAGGSLLALPFLPSLMSSAEAATLPNPKFMVMYWSGHGGLNLLNQSPIMTNPSIASQLSLQSIYPAQNHNILYGKLANLRSTRASNLPYLGTALDAVYGLQGATAADTYSLSPLGADFDNGAARVTPIVGSFVSDAMLAKMNLVCGLDMMYYSGHGTQQSGNYCVFSGNTPTSPSANGMTNVWVPTIDAVMSKYPGFYAGSTPVAPSVVLNSNYYAFTEGMSGYISSYMTPNGITANSNAPANVGAAFNLLFGGLLGTGTPAAAAKKTFILNKVHDDYVRVARGAYGPGRRIGQADRNRFEEFISNVTSLLQGATASSTCTAPAISHADTTNVTAYQGTIPSVQNAFHLYNQLITAAFQCGLTQTFIFGVPSMIDPFAPSGSANPTFTDGTTGPDSHQALFHQHWLANRQVRIVETQRFIFQYGFYDLMQQLNAVAAPQGGTLLDQALMFWTQEAGHNTHDGHCLPMVMAGSAGGFIKTGNFVDLRNANLPYYAYGSQRGNIGMPYNRFLGTALQAMGVPPSFYEQNPAIFAGTLGRIPVSSNGKVPGYGHPYQALFGTTAGNQNLNGYMYDYQLNDMSVPIPIIT